MPLPISTIGAATITRVPTKRMPAAGYASFSFVKMATISSLARPCLANGCAAARHAACNVPRLILGQSVCCTQQPNIRSPHKWTAHAAIRRNRFGFVSGPRTKPNLFRRIAAWAVHLCGDLMFGCCVQQTDWPKISRGTLQAACLAAAQPFARHGLAKEEIVAIFTNEKLA